MTGAALTRPLSSIAYELRAAWALGRRVSLSLERCDVERLEGTVSSVSATGASVTVSGKLVPLDRVLAVHLPSRLGDSTARAAWGRAARQIAGQGQDQLDGIEAASLCAAVPSDWAATVPSESASCPSRVAFVALRP